MATFARLTRRTSLGPEGHIWVNLDLVQTLRRTSEGNGAERTEIAFDGGVTYVAETPEFIAHAAVLEHPLAGR